MNSSPLAFDAHSTLSDGTAMPRVGSRVSARAVCIAMFLFVVSLNFNGFTIFSIGDNFNIKVYHLSYLLVASLIILSRFVPGAPIAVFIYFIVAIISSLVSYLFYGFNFQLFNFILSFYVCAVYGNYFIRMVGHDLFLRTIRTAQVAVCVVILFKNIYARNEILAFVADPIGRPAELFLISGAGLNLESTWLSLGTIWLVGTKWFFPCWVLSFATSLIYASRTGFILALFALLAYFVLNFKVKAKTIALLAVIISLVGVGGYGLIVSLGGAGTYMLERFSTIGEEPGSLGRIVLWQGAIEAIQNNPLGYGIANGIEMIRSTNPAVFEDNCHNMYMQAWMDIGIQGLAAYALLIGAIGRRILRRPDVLGLFLSGYFISGLTEHKGYEPIACFIIGAYLTLRSEPFEASQSMVHAEIGVDLPSPKEEPRL